MSTFERFMRHEYGNRSVFGFETEGAAVPADASESCDAICRRLISAHRTYETVLCLLVESFAEFAFQVSLPESRYVHDKLVHFLQLFSKFSDFTRIHRSSFLREVAFGSVDSLSLLSRAILKVIRLLQSPVEG